MQCTVTEIRFADSQDEFIRRVTGLAHSHVFRQNGFQQTESVCSMKMAFLLDVNHAMSFVV